jgi:hypothetical protein
LGNVLVGWSRPTTLLVLAFGRHLALPPVGPVRVAGVPSAGWINNAGLGVISRSLPVRVRRRSVIECSVN